MEISKPNLVFRSSLRGFCGWVEQSQPVYRDDSFVRMTNRGTAVARACARRSIHLNGDCPRTVDVQRADLLPCGKLCARAGYLPLRGGVRPWLGMGCLNVCVVLLAGRDASLLGVRSLVAR